MIDNNTIKEICDVVTEEVMKRIRQELSAMKPELIQAITDASTAKATEAIRKTVDAQNSTAIRQFQQKIEILERRISQLEMKITKLSAPQPTVSTEKPTITATKAVITAKAVGRINTLSATQVNDILSYPNLYCEANGWIYYIKKGIFAGELYKVRLNGKENQKIFKGKVSANDTLFLNGNILSFMDSNFQPRRIKV